MTINHPDGTDPKKIFTNKTCKCEKCGEWYDSFPFPAKDDVCDKCWGKVKHF
jgi:hypothetical protein